VELARVPETGKLDLGVNYWLRIGVLSGRPPRPPHDARRAASAAAEL